LQKVTLPLLQCTKLLHHFECFASIWWLLLVTLQSQQVYETRLVLDQ